MGAAEKLNLNLLTSAWTQLDYHKVQQDLINSKARFRVVPAGRRSGKTERAKRFLVKKALTFNSHPNGRFVCACPTMAQAKEIYWEDLKALVPKWAMAREPLESSLTIHLINGAKIQVMGMDKPERIEGPALDGIILDEFGNMKETVWTLHVSAALDTKGRPGWAWFIGVPEGRNHYYYLYQDAIHNDDPDWAGFTWKSSDILSPELIAKAKSRMDLDSYLQEYEASFINFQGMAYHSFDRDIHAFKELKLKKNRDLIFTFDFNVKPGTANVLQEQIYQGKRSYMREVYTAVLDEIHIPQNSTTPRICQELIKRYGDHKGNIICYGDATGGAAGTAKVAGSDWDIIEDCLEPVFGDRLEFEVPDGNPRERVRLNSVNSRLRAMDGTVSVLLDKVKCKHTILDCESVSLMKDGSGAIDKKANPKATHHTDGLGYYIVKEFKVGGGDTVTTHYGL